MFLEMYCVSDKLSLGCTVFLITDKDHITHYMVADVWEASMMNTCSAIKQNFSFSLQDTMQITWINWST